MLPITTSSDAAAPVLRVRPTNRSNLAVAATRDAHGLHLVEELPRQLVSAALKDAVGLGYRRLIVEGGEPFLYAGLPGMLARARRLDFDITVVTNGTLLGQSRRWAAVAPLVDRLQVTLHGIGDAHDAVVGRNGIFTSVMENLAVVRDSNVDFGFAVSLTTENVDSLDEIVRLASREGASSVDVTSSFEGGLSDDEVAAAVEAARLVGAGLGVTVESDLTTQDELMLFRGNFVPGFPSRALAAVAPTLVIEPSGRMHPLSTELPERLMLGSLHRARLAAFAPAWLASARAAELAEACDRAWWSAVTPGAAGALRWTGELALHIAEAPAQAAPVRQAIAA